MPPKKTPPSIALMSTAACVLVTPPDQTFVDAWVRYRLLVTSLSNTENHGVKVKFKSTALGGGVDGGVVDMQDAEKRFWSIEGGGDPGRSMGTTTLAYPYLVDQRSGGGRVNKGVKFDWGFSDSHDGWEGTKLPQMYVPERLLTVYDPVVGYPYPVEDSGSMVSRWFTRIGLEECLWAWCKSADRPGSHGTPQRCDIVLPRSANVESLERAYRDAYRILLRLLHARAVAGSDRTREQLKRVKVQVDVLSGTVEANYKEAGFSIEVAPEVMDAYDMHVGVPKNAGSGIDVDILSVNVGVTSEKKESHPDYCVFRGEGIEVNNVTVDLVKLSSKVHEFPVAVRPTVPVGAVEYELVSMQLPGLGAPAGSSPSEYKEGDPGRCIVYVDKGDPSKLQQIACNTNKGFHEYTGCIVPCKDAEYCKHK